MRSFDSEEGYACVQFPGCNGIGSEKASVLEWKFRQKRKNASTRGTGAWWGVHVRNSGGLQCLLVGLAVMLGIWPADGLYEVHTPGRPAASLLTGGFRECRRAIDTAEMVMHLRGGQIGWSLQVDSQSDSKAKHETRQQSEDEEVEARYEYDDDDHDNADELGDDTSDEWLVPDSVPHGEDFVDSDTNFTTLLSSGWESVSASLAGLKMTSVLRT